MNKQKEALRLITTTNMSNRAIGRAIKMSHNTVRRYRYELNIAGIDWSAISSMSDKNIEALLHAKRARTQSKIMPDWTAVHREMQYRDVTLQLLWEEYRLANLQNAYAYSQFTHYYRQYLGKLDLTMRQTHRAGECTQVDFAGRTQPYFDRETNQERHAQLFIGVMPCSNMTFVCAVKSQAKPCWIEAHNKMFAYFGGTTQVVIPDNLKSAVIKPGRDLELNRTYLEMAKHYGVAIVPARVRKPKDKAKAELSVKFIYRWILAQLRHRKFFSIEEINIVIRELLEAFNARPFKKLPGCRRSRFEELEKPLLRSLPTEPFEYAEWSSAHKLGPDYHIHSQNHYYSVPHELVSSRIEARVTSKIVEFYHQGQRVASHVRSDEIGGHTTDPSHQPKSHRAYSEQTPELILKWAKSIGPAAEAVIQHQFDCRPHALLGIRACSTLQRMAKDFGTDRFEAACQRAQKIGSLTSKSIRSILQRGLDSREDQPFSIQVNLPLHENVRGPEYYIMGGQ